MSTIDISLVILLGGFVLAGFWFGVIHMIGAVVGMVFGALVAGRYYDVAANLIAPLLQNNQNIARVIGFFLIFVLVNRLVGLLVYVLERALDALSIIPFLKTFNRLLGAGLGLIEGTLVLGLVVYFAARFPWNATFATQLQASPIAKALETVGVVLVPLLPKAIRALQGVL